MQERIEHTLQNYVQSRGAHCQGLYIQYLSSCLLLYIFYKTFITTVPISHMVPHYAAPGPVNIYKMLIKNTTIACCCHICSYYHHFFLFLGVIALFFACTKYHLIHALTMVHLLHMFRNFKTGYLQLFLAYPRMDIKFFVS